jgi:hypothetical protein
MLWAVLAFEIFVTSLIYALLSTSGVDKDFSLGISLCLAIVLILLSFLLFPRIFFGLRGETRPRNWPRKTAHDKAFQETRDNTYGNY